MITIDRFGKQIRTMYIGEGPGKSLDAEVNKALTGVLQDKEIIDIKPLGLYECWYAVLIIYVM